MPLVPGVALSLLSSSIIRSTNDPNNDQITGDKMVITDETALAVDTLKKLLSMLSLAIQALYGSKKGGLLSLKPGSAMGGAQQLNKAKKVFVSGAKEYVPILLEVVSMLDEPIQLSRRLAGSSSSSKVQSNNALQQHEEQAKAPQHEEQNEEAPASDVDQPPSEPILRKRTESDVDWVDVDHSAPLDSSSTMRDPPSDDALTPSGPTASISSSKASDSDRKRTAELKKSSSVPLEKSVFDDLCSCQDMALYAVSRLVAQTMKYGGGEASTAIWRSIVASLSGNGSFPSTPTDVKAGALDSRGGGATAP